MYFMVINRIRKKIALLFLLISFWLLMYLAAGLVIRNNYCCSITVDKTFSFSYPYSFHIDSMYSNTNDWIRANSPVVIPVVKNLSDFKESSLSVKFKYPPTFILNEQEMPGNEIIYHIDFRDSQGDARGFVQVWQLSVAVKEFLKQSLETSQLSYIEFDEKTYNDGKREWTTWEYTIMGGNGNEYRGLEAFFGDNGRMYRISYFVPESEYSKEHLEIFRKMVKSLEIM